MLTDEQIMDLKSCGVNDGSLSFLLRFARVVEEATIAAEREACKQAVRDEPELPGEIPQAVFDTVQHDKDACAEALRLLVRLTKQGILERIAQRPNVAIEPRR